MDAYQIVGLALAAFALGHLPGHALGYRRGRVAERRSRRTTFVGSGK